MRFVVDAQLPPALARWLTAKGYQCEHVADQHMLSANDAIIWDFAARSGAAIITKDEDFARRRVLANEGPRIVWIRLPNTRTRQLLTWFEAALPEIVEGLERGERLIEIA